MFVVHIFCSKIRNPSSSFLYSDYAAANDTVEVIFPHGQVGDT